MRKLESSGEESSSIAATRTLRIEVSLSSLSPEGCLWEGARAHGCWGGHPAAHFSNGSHIRNLTETKGVGWPRNGLLSAVEHNMRPANQCPVGLCQFSCPAHGRAGGRRGFRTSTDAGWFTATELIWCGHPDFRCRNRGQLSVWPSSQPSNLVTDIGAPRLQVLPPPGVISPCRYECTVSVSSPTRRVPLTPCPT